jgi:hypothetical protein
MFPRFKVSDSVEFTVNLEPTIQNRNAAFRLLGSLNGKTKLDNKVLEATCDVADKYGWYAGDLVNAIGELMEVINDKD